MVALLLVIPVQNVEAFRLACAERTQECWEIGEVAAGVQGIEVIG